VTGCLNNLPDVSKESLRKADISEKKEEYSDKPIIKTTILDFGENRLIVKTTIIYDSLLSCNLVLDFKVIKQQLQFYKNDTEVNSFHFNPKKVNISTSHIKKCIVFENIISEISILQGRDGWLYEITGCGITGNQTEYSGLFTPEGQLIYYSYSTSRNKHVLGVPNELKGNLNSTLNKYGIDINLYLHPKQVTSVNY
jgi:hypothetical protein